MGSFLIFVTLIDQFDLKEKVKKMFKRVKFPSQQKFADPRPFTAKSVI